MFFGELHAIFVHCQETGKDQIKGEMRLSIIMKNKMR